MAKILMVLASARRKGNTGKLAEAFARGAAEAGHQVEWIALGEKRVEGCLGCNACRFGKPCVQRDDFQAMVPAIRGADMLVFASPLYFWTISARMKAFIERFYCLAEEDHAPPLGRYERYPQKDCVLLMTAEDNYFWTFEQAVAYYRMALVRYIGFRDRGMVLAGGCGGTSARRHIEDTGWLEQAYALGRSVYAAEAPRTAFEN